MYTLTLVVAFIATVPLDAIATGATAEPKQADTLCEQAAAVAAVGAGSLAGITLCLRILAQVRTQDSDLT